MSEIPKLLQKKHIDQLANAGDWCLDTEGRVIMSCPFCSSLFVCKDHKVESINPLTLSPSIVGPDCPPQPGRYEILAPCKHHFFVTNGEIIL